MKNIVERCDKGNDGWKTTLIKRQTKLVSDVLGQKGLCYE
jgi:hypothetical protein